MTRLKARVSIAWLVVLFFVAGGVGQVLPAMQLDPMSVFVQLAPGRSYEGMFQVINRGDQVLSVTVLLKDFMLGEEGAFTALEPGTTGDRSLAPFISYAPDRMTLAPGEAQVVCYSFTLPPDVFGPHWGALAVMSESVPETALEEAEEEEGISLVVRVKINYVFIVIQRVPNPPEPAGQVVEVNVSGNTTEKGKKMLTVRSTFQNLCGDVLGCQVYMEVRDEAGGVILRYDFPPDRVVLPDAQRVFSHTFDDVDMPPGQYLILCVVDFGGDYLAAGQYMATITALP